MSKTENANSHLGQLFWPVYQIDVQCIKFDFLVEGRIQPIRLQYLLQVGSKATMMFDASETEPVTVAYQIH